MDEMKKLPDLKGYTSQQLGELAQLACQEQTKKRQEEAKKIEEGLEDLLASKEAKSLRKDFAELRKAYDKLSQDNQVTYNVPLTLNFEVSSQSDLADELACNAESWPSFFSYTVSGKIGKIQGVSPIVAKVLNEQVNNMLDGACEEVMELNPELHKALNAFVAKANQFRDKYADFVEEKLNRKWSLLDRE